MGVDEGRDMRELVREYYGETLQGSDDLEDGRLLLHCAYAAEVRH